MTTPQAIHAQETRRCAALLSADLATLTRLFADDMVWIHGSGKSDGKASMLDRIASGKTQYLEIENSRQNIRFFGQTAIVDGLVDMRLHLAGAVQQIHSRFTICWAWTGADWQVVHWQSTPVRQPA